MRSFILPEATYLTEFFDRTCVFLTTDPWSVAAWSLDDGEVWREPITWSGNSVRARTAPRLALTGEGVVWVSRDQQLVRLDSGEVVEAGGVISRFVCLADGFLVALHEDPSSLLDIVSVARIDADRRVMWRTLLEMPPEMTSMLGPHRMTWDMMLVHDPIVVGDQLAVVGACDYFGGIGCRYGVALDSGEVVWRTNLGAWDHVTLTSHSWLLGQLGYGAYNISEVAPDGSQLNRWPCVGHVVVLPAGAIHVIELATRGHACEPLPGGALRRGAQLPGFHTTTPVLTTDGELVFWRNGELQVVDPELRQRTLAPVPAGETDAPSRMHLTADGTLAFSLGNRLWTTETDFRPLP